MKIRYTHIANPFTEKVYDTEKAYSNNPHVFDTQEEFDQHELQLFNVDKQKGIILDYEIIKEESK